ncbi:hypothetical protein RHMOL_Rhmol11G0049500 [Rhododendron molle]|uniref:Uncharacterized protein n=1 Tax=Rhododendron molle TaxID=49168 RepID=A0ACC0LNN3_RHOML|nr:hypothetical protein RHMOL_Rhmol11G0049500 [Rhododendron molle]
MSLPTISHVVSFNQSTMIGLVITDDQPCRLFQLINDDQPCHRRRSAMSFLSRAMSSVSVNQRLSPMSSTMISHVIADDQPCNRRRSAMLSD